MNSLRNKNTNCIIDLQILTNGTGYLVKHRYISYTNILNKTVPKYYKTSILIFVYLTSQIKCNMANEAVTEKYDEKENSCYVI